MKADDWDVTDEQVVEKTGRSLAHWRTVLDAFGTRGKKRSPTSSMSMAVPRYWARTLTTWYLKQV